MKKNLSKQITTTKSGFTLVELGIAMAFISMLLIVIAVVTTNIVTIYQKGLTLKAVNSVGRGLVDELTAAINVAPSVDTTSLCNSLVSDAEGRVKCEQDHANDFIFHARYADDDVINGEPHKQYNGIFCTGYYSYIWNTYYGRTEDTTIGFKYRDRSGEEQIVKGEAIRLMRIEDKNYRLCSSVMNSAYVSNYKDYNGTDNLIDITELANSNIPYYINTAPHSGMLKEFDLDLELYEFTVFPISQDSVTLRTYMAGTFVLATNRGNIDVTRTGDYCQADQAYVDDAGDFHYGDTSSPFNLGSEMNYCAINKFNFAARTAGSGV